MELITIQNIVLTILLGVMPLLAFSMAFIVVFNLNRLDSKTALNCTFLGFLMILPALLILLSLTK